MIKDVDVLAREWADPHVGADHELARMMDPPVPWERAVVLGDSIAEGLREPVPGYRDLSWADRVSAALTFARPGAVLFNLGRRDLLAAEVRERQLERALSLRPGLAIVTAGGNDALRRRFDPDRLADDLRALLTPLRDAGADVLTTDMYEWDVNPYMPARFAPVWGPNLTATTEVIRAVSAEVGGLHARLREGPAARDVDRFSTDGLHLNARGHGILATDLARALGAARQVVASGV
ncbi:MAG TPA: SGNH/GDSL hydrolase family protein [Baekduia sp.]